MGEFDRSSKWLVQHHGDALLRLAGITKVASWRPLQAELVQPAQLPDGLLEVQIEGRGNPTLFVLEIATYPEKRLIRQVVRDALLVYLNREIVPEVVALVLHPKGNMELPEVTDLPSDLGMTELRVKFRLIELWRIPAEELLATDEPGVMPWVPLSQFEGPPEPVIRRCGDIIRARAPEEECATLLTVTQVLTSLRYNDPKLLSLLGGHAVMIETPLLNELKAEGRAEGKADAILRLLRRSVGDVPEELERSVLEIRDQARLDLLLDAAVAARDLAVFKRLI
jgi:hypothetical protein